MTRPDEILPSRGATKNPSPLTESEHRKLRNLLEDFQEVWSSPTTRQQCHDDPGRTGEDPVPQRRHLDSEIAEMLKREGYRTARNHPVQRGNRESTTRAKRHQEKLESSANKRTPWGKAA